MKRPAVLMTDPRNFAIRGGANPHTRKSDNSLKSVDTNIALQQWNAYVDQLIDNGVDVYVIDSFEGATGMVFAANAGFTLRRDDDIPDHEKVFYPSHFTAEHRRVETAAFASFMRDFGFGTSDYNEALQFEGEADGFPVGSPNGDRWVFTHGFRSDAEIGPWLDKLLGLATLKLKLTDPRFYHGDGLLCSIGTAALVWKGGLDTDGIVAVEQTFSDIVELDDQDALDFIGNSFYVETKKERLLFSPVAIRDEITAEIMARGVKPVKVDISEFFSKGGGGPKCMVFNLGYIDPDDPNCSVAQRSFRASRSVEMVRSNW